MKIKLIFKKFGLALLVVLNGICLTSCGSILHGRNQTIPVSSSPSGASVYVDGRIAGFTPTSVTVDRRQSHVITLAKEGYCPENVKLHPHINGAVCGNVTEGLAIGSLAFVGSVFSMGAIGLPAIIGCAAAGTAVGAGTDMAIGGAYSMSKSSVSLPLQPCRPPFCH